METEDPGSTNSSDSNVPPRILTLAIAALGVVFGDIGTSPLYALRECFVGSHGLPVTQDNVLGSVSLIFWFLTIIVSIKYVVLVMRADNKGEGGILALMALVHRVGPARFKNLVIVSFMGIVGISLLFSDGIITPAISVLSAVEGLSVGTTLFNPIIIPLSIVVLTILFMFQSHGTSKIGASFGPVIIIWFITIAVLGLLSIIHNPAILESLNPLYAITLLFTHGIKGFSLLGTAFLAVTGAEVLYADMGHFGRKPISLNWFSLVFPALILNYMGQGAYLLGPGAKLENLFYRLAPSWFLFPMVVIATLATIIASQAVISGMFTLARQAVQLGFWPRLTVVHTSRTNIGQVFIPFVNLMLFVFTVAIVLIFKQSANLGSAYGIAVSATMLITTVLIIMLPKSFWRIPSYVLFPLFAVFLVLDTSLFCSNLMKLPAGGWIVVFIAVAVVIMMFTWLKGRQVLRDNVESQSLALSNFVNDIATRQPPRISGTAVFLSGGNQTPRALLHNFKHNQVLHSTILILSVVNEELPFIARENRFTLTDLGSGIYHIFMRFGFMETPDVPAVLRTVRIEGKRLDPLQLSYFLGKETLIIANNRHMGRWRKQIYLFLSRNAVSASSFFKLPPNRVVEFGTQIEF